MKKILRFLKYFLGILILLIALLYIFDYDYILKGIKVTYLKGHKTAYIDDYPEFDNRVVKADSLSLQPWPESENYNSVKATDSLKNLNKKLNTAAFLIIKNDSIWFEDYYDQYSAKSKTNSFSMAKSVVVALLGKAIRDGYITSIDEPVSHFYPQYDIRLTVGDLASMSSGLNWNESYYNPFGQTAKAYFDDNIRKVILDLKYDTNYSGYNTKDEVSRSRSGLRCTGQRVGDIIYENCRGGGVWIKCRTVILGSMAKRSCREV